MQGGRDPFSGFGFGSPFGSFGGFGAQGSIMSSFFGGRDPFDDPFFTQPFGGMLESSFFGHNGSPFMGPNLTGFPEPGFFGSNGNHFMGSHPAGFIEQQPRQPNRSRGPIIEELNSEDENEEKEEANKNGNPRKHARLGKGPFVEDPDDATEERKRKQIHHGNEFRQMQHFQPQHQAQTFTFQSSTVSYGGPNGSYYSSSRTRRTGSDGFTFEESKEANSATGQARHDISRGIHNKGHSVTRKLNSDGKVDTMQTLHNLEEDELPSFEENWKGKAKMHLPNWGKGLNANNAIGAGSNAQNGVPNRGGWALPSTERVHQSNISRLNYVDLPSQSDQPITNKSSSSTAIRKADKSGRRRHH